MIRIVAPTGTRLVYVESRGWLLGNLSAELASQSRRSAGDGPR